MNLNYPEFNDYDKQLIEDSKKLLPKIIQDYLADVPIRYESYNSYFQFLLSLGINHYSVMQELNWRFTPGAITASYDMLKQIHFFDSIKLYDDYPLVLILLLFHESMHALIRKKYVKLKDSVEEQICNAGVRRISISEKSKIFELVKSKFNDYENFENKLLSLLDEMNCTADVETNYGTPWENLIYEKD